eukprot:scaffold22404_cov112-Isochrysis_galbana.AAC.8
MPPQMLLIYWLNFGKTVCCEKAATKRSGCGGPLVLVGEAPKQALLARAGTAPFGGRRSITCSSGSPAIRGGVQRGR